MYIDIAKEKFEMLNRVFGNSLVETGFIGSRSEPMFIRYCLFTDDDEKTLADDYENIYPPECFNANTIYAGIAVLHGKTCSYIGIALDEELFCYAAFDNKWSRTRCFFDDETMKFIVQLRDDVVMAMASLPV